MNKMFTYIDVGARESTFPFWKPPYKDINCILFEPDPIEFNKINQQDFNQYNNVTVHNIALSDYCGTFNLHICVNPGCSSQFLPIGEYGNLFNKKDNFTVNKIVKVKCDKLSNYISSSNNPILIKLDVEGGELNIIKSIDNELKYTWLIQTEVNLIPYRNDQCKFGELFDYLIERGFWVIDLKDFGEYRFNGGNKFNILQESLFSFFKKVPFSKGVSCSGDLIFLKDFRLIDKSDYELYIKMLINIEQFDLALHLITLNDNLFDKSLIKKIKILSKVKFSKILLLKFLHFLWFKLTKI
jgi:FkbM family methyltransferase